MTWMPNRAGLPKNRPSAPSGFMAVLAKSPVAVSAKVAQQVEIEIKYEGYIKRQLSEIEKFKNFEKVRIPEDFDYRKVHGLSNELKEKLLYCTLKKKL